MTAHQVRDGEDIAHVTAQDGLARVRHIGCDYILFAETAAPGRKNDLDSGARPRLLARPGFRRTDIRPAFRCGAELFAVTS